MGAVNILLLRLTRANMSMQLTPTQDRGYMQTKPHLPNMQIDTNVMQPYIKHYYSDL